MEVNEQQFFVGAARTDITPELGTQISGDIGRYRPAEEIKDRLYARIVVVKSRRATACVIACDMACVARDKGLEIRSMVADIIDGAVANVMVHCTQSHSAARVGGMFEDHEGILPPELWWVRGETPAYNELFTQRVREGAEAAAEHLVPARVKFARAIEGRCAFNRRFVMRDGSAKTHPKNCDENILYCEGPIDPEASLTLFESLDSKPIAGLLHYTCHPTHGYPHRYISADWPGLWSERHSGATAWSAASTAPAGTSGRRITPTPISTARKAWTRLSWDWVFAMRDLDRLHMINTSPDCDVEIQVFRIGDIVIVGWPGEPFVEAQLEVKLKSKARCTIIGHECNGNGECGYLPTLKASQRGGYEAWGKLPAGTLEEIAWQTIEIIDRLYG